MCGLAAQTFPGQATQAEVTILSSLGDPEILHWGDCFPITADMPQIEYLKLITSFFKSMIVSEEGNHPVEPASYFVFKCSPIVFSILNPPHNRC